MGVMGSWMPSKYTAGLGDIPKEFIKIYFKYVHPDKLAWNPKGTVPVKNRLTESKQEKKTNRTNGTHWNVRNQTYVQQKTMLTTTKRSFHIITLNRLTFLKYMRMWFSSFYVHNHSKMSLKRKGRCLNKGIMTWTDLSMAYQKQGWRI